MMYLLAEQTSVSAGNWILLLLDATLKGSVILIAAVLLDSALRSTSASNRYRMWCCALCSLAAIPLLAGVLPKWQVPLLPNPDLVSVSQASDSTAIDTKPPIQLAVPEKAIAMVPVFESRAGLAPVVPHFQPQDFDDLNILAHLLTQEVDSQTSKDDKQRAIITQSSVLDTTPNEETSAGFAPFSLPDWHWSVWVVMIWVTGTLGLIVYLFAGVSRIAAITRSAIPLDDEDSTETLRKLSRQAGVLRPVRLLHCRQIRIPMTWGHLHPVILLPTSCINWSKTRRRIVLLHELVHIRRGDWLMQIASQLICAAYWCNPLVWIATRRLCIERERACDDQVLGFGTRPTVYASHLLDIARNIASGGSLTMASLGMAHRSQLEGRLLSILDPGTKRHGFGRIATLTAIIGMGAGVMPLAAIQPWAESTTREIADPIDDGERNIETTRIDGEIVIKSDGKYNFNWTEDDVEYRIRIRGKVVLTEDGVESISDDGYLRIIVEDDDDERRVVIRMGEDGDLSYDLRFNGEKRKLSDKARRWVKRVVRKTVHQIQKFEASMDELDENMKHLDIEMKEMQEQLHRQLSEIEIPDMQELHLQLKKLSEMEDLDFGDLHIQISDLDIPELEGLQEKLAVLHDLKIKDLDTLHIRIPNIKVLTDINVKKLDKLKKLNRIRIKEMREQAGASRKAGEQIRIQIRKQMEALHEQFSQLHDLDFDFGDFEFDGDFEFGDFKFGDFEFGDFKFEFDHHTFEFDHEEFEKKLESALKQHGNTFERWSRRRGHDLSDIHEQLEPHLEQLHKHLQGLHLEMPDMKRLHERLEPMMRNLHKNMPQLEGLSERIQKHLKPQMEKLHKRMEVLHEYIDQVREEIADEVRDVIEEEISEADLDLSRSQRKRMSRLVDELVEAITNNSGMNIDDGVVQFNDSKRRILKKLSRIVRNADFDFDDDAAEQLEEAVERIADRLSDLEIEIDADLSDKIENFDVEFDFDPGDLKFDFDFGDDDDDDDEGDIAFNSNVA